MEKTMSCRGNADQSDNYCEDKSVVAMNNAG